MQQKVVALSRCLETSLNFHRFHFRGVYLGQSIVEINLCVKDNIKGFEKGADYLLYIDVIAIRRNKLIGSLIRHKRI